MKLPELCTKNSNTKMILYVWISSGDEEQGDWRWTFSNIQDTFFWNPDKTEWYSHKLNIISKHVFDLRIIEYCVIQPMVWYYSIFSNFFLVSNAVKEKNVHVYNIQPVVSQQIIWINENQIGWHKKCKYNAIYFITASIL